MLLWQVGRLSGVADACSRLYVFRRTQSGTSGDTGSGGSGKEPLCCGGGLAG